MALVGPLADSQRDIMGSWSAAGVAKQSVSLLQGMRSAMAGKGTVLRQRANISDNKGIQNFLNLYEQAVSVDARSPQQLIDEAVAQAKSGRGSGGRGRGAGHGA